MSQTGGGTQTTTALQSTNCTKVFIQRDYSEGTSVKFHTRLPSELEGLVSACLLTVFLLNMLYSKPFVTQIERPVFESTINRLNEFFAEAEKGTCSTYCEGCIGCLTAYLIYMCSETHYEKVISKCGILEKQQNGYVYFSFFLTLLCLFFFFFHLRCMRSNFIHKQFKFIFVTPESETAHTTHSATRSQYAWKTSLVKSIKSRGLT